MIGRVLTGIKRFILWDYPRASRAYDLMVGIILAFIFLTPREWFRDQPRIPPKASSIAMLPAMNCMSAPLTARPLFGGWTGVVLYLT